jgi:restriction system protein
MGRRSGFTGLLVAISRDIARQQRLAEAERRRQQRELIRVQRHAIRMQKEGVRLQKLAEKEERERYIEDRIEEVSEKNIELEERIQELKDILGDTLTINDTINFDSLKIKDEFHLFNPPDQIAMPIPKLIKEKYFSNIKKPSGLKKLMPGAEKKWQESVRKAEHLYKEDFSKYIDAENNRLEKLEAYKEEYEKNKKEFEAKVNTRNAEVDGFEKAYFMGDIDEINTYNSMVLERSSYPEAFPHNFKTAYVPESKQIVIDYELPTPNIVPTALEYKYNKSKDSIEEKPKKLNELKEIYQDVVASVALRTVHEVFEADQGNHLDVCVFNGYINTLDPSNGKDIKPFLISVRATKSTFNEINLSKINKIICLRNLGAQVSPRPYEIQPVKPIVEFDMVDKRFVEQNDLLGKLDSRPNIYELNPYEFENLVSNLFQKLGLETKLTRTTKDGGVDVVAFDLRPVLGGKVVIQAKRYRNTVGVSAVRDLYGTMMNEGANKGILVTTSGYGPDAFEFAKEKPIELMDGGQLLYLLNQIGFEAKIILPNE